MKHILTLLVAILVGFFPSASKEKENTTLNYEIVGNGNAQGSGTIVRITIVTKKKNSLMSDDFAKAAVHGVLFRGYTDRSFAGIGSAAKKPAMMGSPMAETQKADFFKPFFDGGTYAGYVQCMEETRKTVKVGKEWKISCDVLVSETQLRKDLIDAGVLKKIGAGL